jgi:outer membrane receptor protein involved in Fe transport
MQRNRGLGWILLSGASLSALCGQASAQEEAVSEEIVVTATGREARVQDVPLAVTALTGQELEDAGVKEVRDLQQLAPSFRFFTGQSNSAGTAAFIRGIGTGGDNPGFESAVGVFIDGIYRSRSGVALGDLPEIERVEVLRGPQGTLFGRNTSAGAISIVTVAPDFEPEAWGAATGGSLGALGGSFGLNTPIVGDTLAVRLDGSARARDGYITDTILGRDINDRDRWTVRGQALWDISPNTSFRFIVDGAATDEQCCTAVTLIGNGPGLLINSLLGPGSILAPDMPPGSRANPEDRLTTVTPIRDFSEEVDEWGASGQLDWDLDWGDFTSITAWRDWEALRNQDIDFSVLDRAFRQGLEIEFKTFTQELRLHGESGRLDWLVGFYYLNETLDQTDTIRVGTQGALFVDAFASAVIPGNEVYRSINPAAPLFFQNSLATLAATIDPAVPNAAAIAAGWTNFGDDLALALSVTDPINGDGQQADHWNVDTNSFALFTHNEYSFTDTLVLTLGARFNHEEKDLNANLFAITPSCAVLQGAFSPLAASVTQYQPNPLLPAAQQAQLLSLQNAVLSGFTLACNPAVNTIANGVFSDSLEENEWTGTASLAWHVSDDVLTYGSYSRGYKSGGFNIDRSGFNILPFSNPVVTPNNVPNTNDLEFGPEFVNAYELGAKTTLLEGTTNINVALFYEEIEDFQVNAFSGFNFITFNAPKLISKGVEVDFLSQPFDDLNIQGGVVYDDAYYDETVIVNPLVAADVIPAGTTLAFAAKWVVTGAITYTYPIHDNLEARFSIDGRWNSSYPVQTLNRNPATDNDDYSIFNALIGLGQPDERWTIEAFVRNLTDEYYNIGAFQVPEQTGRFAVYPNEPRTWGLTLRGRI